MDIEAFADIAEEFHERVSSIVWCTVATIDRLGRPRSRILHPMWDGATGYIMTGRRSLKARHIESRPYVSLSYWDAQKGIAYADCRARWLDDLEDRRRVWKLFESTPEPYGYNPALFFPSPDDPGFGVLELIPWRIEVTGLADLMQRRPPRVWRRRI